MESNPGRYIPALGGHALTPLFDPLMRLAMREAALKAALVRRLQVQPGGRVLDLACGTGTLAIMIKRSLPGVTVTGLDADPEMLSRAAAKARRARVSVSWDRGTAVSLPYPSASFDAVVSSLAINHLASPAKVGASREVRRVLRRGGSFHILDFGRPYSPWTRLAAAVFGNLEEVRDNVAGRTQPMLREAGFDPALESQHEASIFGAIWFYDAAKP